MTAPQTPDPVVAALQQRASDLSFALSPAAIARKLREELIQAVGPDRAVAYYIGASTEDGKNIRFEVARLGPAFLARLVGDTHSATLTFSWERTTAKGWRISIGVSASAPYHPPKGSRLQGSFAVTIAR